MAEAAWKCHIAICPYCRRIVQAEHLTSQQWEEAKRIIEGHSTEQIGHDLFICSKTVQTHFTKIMEVLNIEGRSFREKVAKLIRWANDNGYLALMGWDETRK